MDAAPLPTNATENITSINTFFQYVNFDLAEGWFFVMMLFSIFLIIFIIMKANFTTSRSFAFSSFFCMVLSIMLRTIGFITNEWMYLFMVFTAFSGLWLYLEDKG